jgi:hypothetical protein
VGYIGAGMYKLLILLALTLAGCAGHAPPKYELQRRPARVLRIQNNFSSTTIVRLYLTIGRNKQRLTTVGFNYQTVYIPNERDLSGHYLMLEAYNEETWYSADLLSWEQNECLELRVGSRLKYSGIFPCSSSRRDAEELESISTTGYPLTSVGWLIPGVQPILFPIRLWSTVTSVATTFPGD